MELAVDAVKLLWQLCDRQSVEDRVSSNVLAWSVLLALLQAVYFTVRLQWQLDLTLAASYYAREGAVLTKSLHLRGW